MRLDARHRRACGRLRRMWGVFARMRDLVAYAPASRWVFLLCLAVFLAQKICDRVVCVQGGYSFGYVLLHTFGLCPNLLAAGFVWQPVTYMFLHATWWHLLLNALALLLLGAGIEREIGTRRFLRLLLLGGVVGGLAWAAWDTAVVQAAGVAAPAWLRHLEARALAQRVVTHEGNAICVGASAGAFALIGACAALFPNRKMLLFLVVPVRTRTLAWALGLLTVVLLAHGLLGGMAHAAHLAGGVAGYWYGRHLAAEGWGDTPA